MPRALMGCLLRPADASAIAHLMKLYVEWLTTVTTLFYSTYKCYS